MVEKEFFFFRRPRPRLLCRPFSPLFTGFFRRTTSQGLGPTPFIFIARLEPRRTSSWEERPWGGGRILLGSADFAQKRFYLFFVEFLQPWTGDL